LASPGEEDLTVAVAAVQVLGGAASANEALSGALELAEEAAEEGAGILCLPERWLPQDPLDPRVDDVLAPFRSVAKRHGVHVVPGGLLWREGERTYVVCPLIGPGGELLGGQAKMHLFGEERKRFTPGADYKLFPAGRLGIGIMVCYDAAFPEVARILSVKGADIILAPSRIRSAGLDPWHLYLKARALENRVPVVGVNVSAPPRYNGRSLIVGIDYNAEDDIVYPKTLAEAGGDACITTATIEIGLARRLKERRLAQRRPDTYLDLAKG